MKSESLVYLTDAVVITAVVPTGHADAILKAARELGATGGIVHMARGTGARERLGLLGIAVEAEKEVINIIVASDHQEMIAEAVYRAGEMDVPASGYLYIMPIERMALYLPEEARQRLDQRLGSATD